MLKKMSASIGLVIAAAAAAPLTSSPAYAHMDQVRGWHSHHRSSHHSHHRNHNWNGNSHRARIFIRIYVYNKNNNRAIAVVRPERRETRPVRQDDDFIGAPGGVGATRAGGDVAVPNQETTGTVPVT